MWRHILHRIPCLSFCLLLWGVVVDARVGRAQTFAPDPFLYGACVYPEIQPRAEWRQMLDHFKAADINVVRVAESAWGTIETAPGTYDFTWLDQFLDDARAARIKVILGTSTYVPPQWLVQRHPELMRIENGQAAYPIIKKLPALGDSTYRRHALRYTRNMAAHYAGHPAVLGWQLDNEIDLTLNSIYENPAEAQRWQQWLSTHFRSPADVNERWQLKIFSQQVQDFRDVPLLKAAYVPYTPVGIRMNYWRFRRDEIFDFFAEQIAALRTADPRWVTTNWVEGWRALTDDPRAGQLLAVSSVDVYHPSDEKPEHWRNTTMHFDLNRSVGNHGTFLVMETAMGVVGNTAMDQFIDWAGGAMVQRDRFLMQNLCPAAFGAAGLLYWTGNRIHGSHAPYYGGVVGWDGRPELEYPWVKEVGAFYKKWGATLARAPVRADVAIYTDYEQRLALSTVGHVTGSEGITRDLFDTFHRLGYGTDGINGERIRQPGALNSYALVVLAATTMLDEAAVQALRRYVEQGGRVLVTPLCDYVTPDALMKRRPGAALAELTGASVRATRLFGGATAHDYPLPQVRWSADTSQHLTMALNGLAELLDVTNPGRTRATFASAATVLDGHPAVVSRRLGRGEVMKLAFWPDQAALAGLLVPLLERIPSVTTALLPVGVHAVPRRDGSVFVVNTTQHALALSLQNDRTDRITGALFRRKNLINPYQVLWLK